MDELNPTDRRVGEYAAIRAASENDHRLRRRLLIWKSLALVGAGYIAMDIIRSLGLL